jgi:hypothetical protein
MKVRVEVKLAGAIGCVELSTSSDKPGIVTLILRHGAIESASLDLDQSDLRDAVERVQQFPTLTDQFGGSLPMMPLPPRGRR